MPKPGPKQTKRTIINDVYFTQNGADFLIDWLVKELFIPSKGSCGFIESPLILDACAGESFWPLGNAFQRLNRGIVHFVDEKIHHSDIISFETPKHFISDILNWQGNFYDYIICNPPWSPVERAEAIYHILISLLKKDGILFFIINHAFVNTNWQRGQRLGRGIQIALPRYLFAKSLKTFKPDSTGLLDPYLLINRQRITDPPFFCPIPPEICKTDQKLLGLER